MSMHYLMRDVNASWYCRIRRKAEEVGVDPAIIRRFERAQYIVRDGPESWTNITDEAWEEIKDALAKKGVNIGDIQ